MSSPPTSIEDQIAEHFYEWELRGRGWQVWDEPVEPEPPFTPFFGHFINDAPAVDDGRTHTRLSGLIDWLHRKLGPGGSSAPTEHNEPEEVGPSEWNGSDDVTELQLSVPASLLVTPDAAEQFLIGLSSCRRLPAFEVVGTRDAIHIQLACDGADVEQVRAQVESRFPEVVITPRSGFLERHWADASDNDGETAVVEFGLGREFMLPLAVPRSFTVDPLIGLAAALSGVDDGEVGLLQVLFRPVRHRWAESILRSVTLPDGSPLFTGFRDFIGQAKAKVSRPLYAAVLRVACRSRWGDRAWELAKHLVAALAPLDNPEGNELIPLENDGYDEDEHERDVLLRRSRRGGMLLSSEELASLVHLPSASVRTPKLRQRLARTKAAPSIVLNQSLALGENQHAGETRRVTLSPDQRVKHTHVIGASGTGKSTLLLNLIIQDMRRGDGVAVLDPHGDLIDTVIRHVPPERAGDVVLFDPGDEEFPVGFNILSAHSATEKNLLASDLVSVFRRLSSSWGDQMTAVLGNAILAFLESSTGGTLADLRRFLVEPAYRKEFLATVQDPEVVYYWTKEFSLLTGRPQGPVLTRLDTFLRPKPIRHMVAQRRSRLDFVEIMDGRRIFLARLSHGAIGEENAHLLGALLVSKFHQMALGRQRLQESERSYFWMYVDEFQNFATPSMAALLSGVRKYRLGLILAHQELHQLEAKAPDVASALLSNAYTRVCFRVGDQDARKLENGFSSFEAADLQNLGTGEAVARAERAEFDFNVRTLPLPAVDETTAAAVQQRIVSLSRQKYAARRVDVEAELLKARGDPSVEEPQKKTRSELVSAPVPIQFEVVGVEVDNTPSQPPLSELKPVMRPPKPMVSEPRPLGRGGSEHVYLQQLIKQYAEGLGYKAGIEENVLGGRGVDVALRKGEVTIACEICITTDDAHELGNVRKCLEAGYQHVVAVSPDARRLMKLRRLIKRDLNEGELARVHFFAPPDLFAFIQEIEVQQLSREQEVRGYKIKTNYKSLDADDGRDRRHAMTDTVARAMKRIQRRKRT